LTSPSSLRILNVLLRSANNAEHFLCRVCTFAAAWTSVLVTFLKFTSATTHILTTRDIRLAANSHKLRALYLQNSVPSPLYLHICINPLLTEKCAISAVSPYLYQPFTYRKVCHLRCISISVSTLYLQNSVPSPLYLHICINPLKKDSAPRSK